MKNSISYFTIFILSLFFCLSSCEKENFDTTSTTIEVTDIPTVFLDGDCFLGFAFTRPNPGGGFSVSGGSTNNATISVEEIEINGFPTYAINSFVQDGGLYTQKLVFHTDLTVAGDYPLTELTFTTPDSSWTYGPDQIIGLLTISDFSQTDSSVNGNMNVTLIEDVGVEYSYSTNFEFVPFQ